MRLRNLLIEARVFQNNFIRVSMIEEEFNRIFQGQENIPKLEFDENGMYTVVDNFFSRQLESNLNTDVFSLSDGGFVDQIKSKRKLYIEFTKIDAVEQPTKNDQADEETNNTN